MDVPATSSSNSRGPTTCDSHLNAKTGLGPTAPNYAEIIVVRHGETCWNAEKRIQGHLDIKLNEVGRQQAAAVADRLSKETKISAVYSSDLKRAFETASIIAHVNGVPEVVQCPELRERNLGDLQGLTLIEAAELKPDAYEASKSSKTDLEMPGGGESLDQLYNRCTSSLQRIAMDHIGKKVVVVSHGGAIRTLFKRAAPSETLPGKILNASVNIFHISGDEWIIKTWNDVSHLKSIGLLDTGFGGDGASG